MHARSVEMHISKTILQLKKKLILYPEKNDCFFLITEHLHQHTESYRKQQRHSNSVIEFFMLIHAEHIAGA